MVQNLLQIVRFVLQDTTVWTQVWIRIWATLVLLVTTALLVRSMTPSFLVRQEQTLAVPISQLAKLANLARKLCTVQVALKVAKSALPVIIALRGQELRIDTLALLEHIALLLDLRMAQNVPNVL